MDERLLKRSVESIEMPDDMKDRIIENCRSGEAKPLFMPKKRFVYMPMAATACVCVLVAALAGVGVWQLKVLSDNGSQPPGQTTDGIVEVRDDVISINPITTEDIDAAWNLSGFLDGVEQEDIVYMDNGQLSAYYGIDVSTLSDGPSVLVEEGEYKGPGEYDGYVFMRNGGTGEIYYDKNFFTHDLSDGGSVTKKITVILSRKEMPNSIEKLWDENAKMSVLHDCTVSIGQTPEGIFQAEFSMKPDGYTALYVTVNAQGVGIDELCDTITGIVRQQRPVPALTPLTLEKLREICGDDPSKLSWSDFNGYEAKDVGSGLYILEYNIEGAYTLLIGGVPEEEPYYMLFSLIGRDDGIDIREGGLEDYLDRHTDIGTTMPLTLEKLKSLVNEKGKDLTWSDFEQFESTAFGSGLLYRQYDIEGKYTLTIGGVPYGETLPLITFYVHGQYYAIDIREDSLEDYLNEPVPEGDVINVIPITWEDIENGKYIADGNAWDEDKVYLTDKQLTEYYGIDITSFGGMPEGFRATEDGALRYVLVDWDSGEIYYDINSFTYTAPDRPGIITVSVSTLPNHIDKLTEDKKMCSRIGDRFVTIGQTEDGHYEVEILSADNVLGIGISAEGVTLEELCKVIAALVEQTEVRDCVNEEYPYPWLYIDSITASDDTEKSELSQTVPEDALNNTAAYGKLEWPTDGGYICEWGYWDGGYAGHAGIDITGMRWDDPVYAGADGVVTYAGWNYGLGNYVEIYHPDLGISTGYAHNGTLYVSVGQQVAQGDLIAGAGGTGTATGIMLHLTVKVNGVNVNPKDYLSRLITENDR